MQEQLELLKELQGIDTILAKAENKKIQVPKSLAQLEKEHDRREAELEKERAALEKVKEQRRSIEQKLKAASPLIGQAVAIGDGRPYNVALLVLDPDAGVAWAGEHGLDDGSAAALHDDPGVCAAIAEAVEAATGVRPELPASLADLYDREERFTVLPNDLAAIRAHISEHARPVTPPGNAPGNAAERAP